MAKKAFLSANRLAVGLATLFLVAASPSLEARPKPQFVEAVCPIGGELFNHIVYSASYVAYTNPDGSPEGDIFRADDLPECPANGLLLFKEFLPSEIAILTPLLVGAEFQYIRKSETPYFRAYWLAGKIGSPLHEQISLLVAATWETNSSKQRMAYLKLLASQSDFLKTQPVDDELDWYWERLVYINAWRETGQFEEATTRLRSLPVAKFDLPAPIPEYGPEEEQYGEKFKPVLNRDQIYQWQEQQRLFDRVRKMQVIIDRRDSGRTLLELLPPDQVSWICRDRKISKMSASNQKVCRSPSMVTEVARLKLEADANEREAKAYKKDYCAKKAKGEQPKDSPETAAAAAANAAVEAALAAAQGPC